MLKATTLSATRKVIIEPFRPIVQILDETLPQVATRHIVDVMLQIYRATDGRISVRPLGAHVFTRI